MKRIKFAIENIGILSFCYIRRDVFMKIEILNRIVYDVLTALYQLFWAAILISFLSMFLYLYAKEHAWKKGELFHRIFSTWIRAFQSSKEFQRVFLLTFYTAMILLRTLLNREIWFDPLGVVMQGWGLYQNGQLTTEAIENFMLFLPFSLLLCWAFRKELFGTDRLKLKDVLWKMTKIVFIFSLSIESAQVLFHLGTFQFSDLCYNTLGGILGGMLYYIGEKWKNRIK